MFIKIYEYSIQVVSARRSGQAVADDAGTLTVTDTSNGAITLYDSHDRRNTVSSPITLKGGRATFWTATNPIKIVAAVTVPITQTITATNWTPNDHKLVASDPIS